MALRNTFFGPAAAIAVALAPVAATLPPTQSFAQEATPATFSLEGQVYTTQAEAQNDPAFSDGAIFIGDAGFLPLGLSVEYLEQRNIQAAIINQPDSGVTLLFDGNLVKSWDDQEEFVHSMGGVLSTIEDLKAQQAASLDNPLPTQG